MGIECTLRQLLEHGYFHAGGCLLLCEGRSCVCVCVDRRCWRRQRLRALGTWLASGLRGQHQPGAAPRCPRHPGPCPPLSCHPPCMPPTPPHPTLHAHARARTPPHPTRRPPPRQPAGHPGGLPGLPGLRHDERGAPVRALRHHVARGAPGQQGLRRHVQVRGADASRGRAGQGARGVMVGPAQLCHCTAPLHASRLLGCAPAVSRWRSARGTA
jgi:hypothetical protein